MPKYCTPIPSLHVATLPKFLLRCQVQFWAKHRGQQHVASKLAQTVHTITPAYAPRVHGTRTASDTPPQCGTAAFCQGRRQSG